MILFKSIKLYLLFNKINTKYLVLCRNTCTIYCLYSLLTSNRHSGIIHCRYTLWFVLLKIQFINSKCQVIWILSFHEGHLQFSQYKFERNLNLIFHLCSNISCDDLKIMNCFYFILLNSRLVIQITTQLYHIIRISCTFKSLNSE